MKKIILVLLTALLIQFAFSQVDTFDILTYAPPKDWKKNTNESAVSYTSYNQKTGGYCILAVYSAKISEGTPEKDFESEWNDLVVAPFGAEKNPKTETQSSGDGWTGIAGAAPITYNGSGAEIILTTISGFGKATSVIATLNDQSYIPQVDSFFGSVKPDKNATIKTPVPSKENTQSTAVNSIIGRWSDHSSAIGNYVTSSGAFVGSADVNTMEEYEFKTDHTYVYKFFGMSAGKLYYTETTGTFSLDGRNLTLTPLKRRGGYSGNIQDEQKLLGKSEVYDCYIGPNKWEPGPFLNLHKDGNYYLYSDYQYDYFKRLQ